MTDPAPPNLRFSRARSGLLAVLGVGTLVIAGLLGVACGEPNHEEFGTAGPALAGHLGKPCGEQHPSVRGTAFVEVEDDSKLRTECGGGLCVWKFDGSRNEPASKVGACSCRCAGPHGTGPFCTCRSGFTCTNLVLDLGSEPDPLAGSYCMPNR